MPNWTYTDLTITGPAEDRKRFLEGLKTSVDEYTKEMYYSIFDTYFPTPPELMDTVAPAQGPEDAKHQAELAKRFGAGNWYEWQSNNWGIKWGDCRTQLTSEPDGDEQLSFHLEMPWATGSLAWMKISGDFPTLLFMTDMEEEGCFFSGEIHYQAGKIVLDALVRPSERCDDEDEEEEVSE